MGGLVYYTLTCLSMWCSRQYNTKLYLNAFRQVGLAVGSRNNRGGISSSRGSKNSGHRRSYKAKSVSRGCGVSEKYPE